MLSWMALAPAAQCQITEDFKPPQANCCLQMFAQRLADQMQDWNQLGRYHADDAQLMSAAPDPRRVVFLGDSITDGWNLAKFSPTSLTSIAVLAGRPRRRCWFACILMSLT